MPDVYVDADACPVKPEVLRVAERHGLEVYLVSNAGMRPQGGRVHTVVVGSGFDAADDWIAEHAKPHDIVITADILLAARCVAQKAYVLGPTGKRFSDTNIGGALAMRELNAHLRETGESKGHNPSFTPRDRSQFLQAMEEVVQMALRASAD